MTWSNSSPSPDARRFRSFPPEVSPSSKTVLVVGATGFLGPALVEEFVAAGFRVVCGVRNPEKAARQCDLPEVQCIRIYCNEDLAVATWLRHTGVRSLSLSDSYKAYGQGAQVYEEFIRQLRDEHLT